jgi:anti-anti-sigma regulatory factor/PAS domain-containing protein
MAARPARAEVGARERVPETTLAGLCLTHPGVPVLIPSVDGDARLDAHVRELGRALGITAAIMLSLALRGRIVGLLTIQWARPVALGAREQRVYQALACHVALALDNLVMTDRMGCLLAESQRERRLLSTVLEHVPVGILCIAGPTRRPLLTNRMGRLMLTGDPGPVSEALPLAHMLYPDTDEPICAEDLAGVRAARTGQRQERELDLIPPGGSRISVVTIGVPVLDADGKVDQVVVVMNDITGRKRAAQERAQLQEAVIQAQAAALVERSTPLIPITDDILVMPLIGLIDDARGQGILDVALQGARERRARVTILDVTGVPSIDAQAAAVLTRTAQALRLIGVVPVLSGVCPAVSRALVELDVPLTGIVTCGSLQAGIKYAMRRR